MSTCSNSSSTRMSMNGVKRMRNNRIGYQHCDPEADDDIEFSEVTERIILNINTVFEKDDALDEFDIIVEESQSNHSPVFHIDHKLAIESWCVPFLYQHSLQHFNTTIIIPSNEKVLAKRNACVALTSYMFSNGHASNASSMATATTSSSSGHYFQNSNSTCKSCARQISPSYSKPTKPPPQLTELERMKRGHELTRILLLINPDYTTAWNFRRELFLKKRHVYEISLQSELNLIALICSRKPKCLEAFSYRRWIIQEQLNPESSCFASNSSRIWANPVEFFQNEVKFIQDAAGRYFSNYHAWTYRTFLLDSFASHSSQVTNIQQKQNILEAELASANDWLQAHVSDHSGCYYRQKLLIEVSEHYERQKYVHGILKLFTDELKENYKMICYYIGHESLWYHRRAVLKQLLSWSQQTQILHKQQFPSSDSSAYEPSSAVTSNYAIDFESVVNSVYLDEKSLVEYAKNDVATSETCTSTSSSTSGGKGANPAPDYSLININVFDQTKNLKQLNLIYAQRHAKWCQYSFGWTI